MSGQDRDHCKPWFHPLPGSTRADGKLAELAEQVGKMVEHHRSKSTQPSYLVGFPTLHVDVTSPDA